MKNCFFQFGSVRLFLQWVDFILLRHKEQRSVGQQCGPVQGHILGAQPMWETYGFVNADILSLKGSTTKNI